MPAPKQTKKQRIDEARAAAKAAREKREKRQKTLRVLVPVLVTVIILALAGGGIALYAALKPAPSFPGGPANMVTDGIAFQAKDSKSTYVPTAALKKGQSPKAVGTGVATAKAHIVTYIDWTCPACKSFESTYSTAIQSLVASGDATLEVHPIAILDSHYTTDYSTRAANAAACVANYAPSKFIKVQTAMYDGQASEGGPGLTDNAIVKIVKKAGVTSSDVETCIRDARFEPWVKAATDRTTSQSKLIYSDNNGSFATPTITVNGKLVSANDFSTAVQTALGSASAG